MFVNFILGVLSLCLLIILNIFGFLDLVFFEYFIFLKSVDNILFLFFECFL